MFKKVLIVAAILAVSFVGLTDTASAFGPFRRARMNNWHHNQAQVLKIVEVERVVHGNAFIRVERFVEVPGLKIVTDNHGQEVIVEKIVVNNHGHRQVVIQKQVVRADRFGRKFVQVQRGGRTVTVEVRR